MATQKLLKPCLRMLDIIHLSMKNYQNLFKTFSKKFMEFINISKLEATARGIRMFALK